MNSNRTRGILLGLACGDALGRPVEFSSASSIAAEHGQLNEMIGHGTWNQPAGTITDDTEQALCIARSLVEQQAFDPEDIASRFVDWYDSDPFDIGRMTMKSLSRLKHGDDWSEAGQHVWETSPEGQNAGNGSVMRCPPLAIPYATDWERLVTVSRQSSQITHADPRCTYGCAVLNLTLAGLLDDVDTPLRNALDYVDASAPDELTAALRPLARGDQPDLLETSGYVIHSLQTALHDGLHTTDAEEAIVTAVNRGGDTDTIGAITGAIAGARFGASQLPDQWLAVIDEVDELEALAMELEGPEE
ncbi:ADP-ribosylglycohydrolase family protein [Halorubrum ezzemoulense]|uniref:ADP-ribosylglycohydrolase family protein n=1 Tax=Halorubrum ezzemoulense TaxID=337243 RepID=UPI00232AE5C6|nr:ADP-ribosylglycohydrolase family protein [Halorubrum ezzemoulense]MDB9253940.1 ADP-ribosylglycohydrolase family protein [Halorubrum ezzemoulense]MDB9257134.1 ADP-ribosylglycohydrolase family protein [Halorubrum ezzemoulense]MDB9263826.1 ADP-ribosylglycohydrolase family protein [Halorubrum ezzemoulense]MDB9274831.1 ADP-ribosylglycohydrolase family protein [Halorubrum ezzemoulense]MDB9277944.1 ADP-ribosylglycohydrolase family protein [Halorubrum ezzemoulense]